MDEMKKLTDQLDYLLMKKIINGLRDGSVSIPNAKLLAHEYLAVKPFDSVEDAKQKVHNLINITPLYQTLKDYMDAYHEEQKINSVIEKMRQHMDNNNVDAALEVANTT